ncbi:MAG TPA: S9 family peptidase [Candidatus Limnocylindria bacterium]|nr:S9 family peptidase [Candidatus Limnocylindria bacterium]
MLPPLVAEDLVSLRFVGDAQISPDGRRIAFVVRTVDWDENAYRAAIWVVPFDGSEPPAQFTSGTGQDSSPRWSPDGRSLAFLSDRPGAAPKRAAKGDPRSGPPKKPPKQLHVMPARGGEARQLTTFADDASDIAWSPRSDALAVVVRDAREGADDEPAIRVYDRVRYKSDEGGLFDLRRKHLWVVCLDGTPARRLTDGDWDDAQPSFSPDGTEIAFVSNRTGERDRNTVADIWVVPWPGGEPRRITDGNGTYGNPSWSRDGSRVAAYGTPEAADSAGTNVHAWSFSPAGGDARLLTKDWDRTVGSVVMSDVRAHVQTTPATFTSDGSRVLFVASDRGTAGLYSADASGGGVRAETRGEHQLVAVTLDSDARRYAAVRGTATDPGEVVAGEVGGAERRLTSFNDDLLASRWIGAPERVEFGGADGWRIEGWVIKPRGFDPAKKWPLVLEVHGGPHAAYGHGFFSEFQVLAGRGYAVLYTNPRGSHAYGEEFVKACIGDWGGKDYEDLMAGVDHALGWGWVDPARLYVTGGSYGGFMTNWIVGHTERFKAAATQRSISNNISAFGTSDIGWHFWEREHGATPWREPEKLVLRSPLTYVEKVRTPLLILHAERDLRCPIEQAEQMFVALRVLGREAVFVRYPEDNHDLTRGGKPKNRVDHCRRIADWFDAHP